MVSNWMKGWRGCGGWAVENKMKGEKRVWKQYHWQLSISTFQNRPWNKITIVYNTIKGKREKRNFWFTLGLEMKKKSLKEFCSWLTFNRPERHYYWKYNFPTNLMFKNKFFLSWLTLVDILCQPNDLHIIITEWLKNQYMLK